MDVETFRIGFHNIPLIWDHALPSSSAIKEEQEQIKEMKALSGLTVFLSLLVQLKARY